MKFRSKSKKYYYKCIKNEFRMKFLLSKPALDIF